MNEAKSRSNLCKLECIDEGRIFCPNAVWSGGKCCEVTERCPKDMYCTNDNPKAPNLFKYLLCPNEPACESKVIYPKYDGEVLIRTVDQYEHKFVQDDVCGYIIYSPWEMTPDDKLLLKI